MEREGKYSPSMLFVLAVGRYCPGEEMKSEPEASGDMPTGDFRIFIRNSKNKSRCYQIAWGEGGQPQIWEGPCTGDIWRKMPESVLFENKDILGEVILKRKHLRVKEYRTYDQFWEDLKPD